MAHYMVIANGTLMGTYEGETTDDAVSAYLDQAGYSTAEEAAEVLSMTPEEWRAQIEVREATIEVTDVEPSTLVERDGAVDAEVLVGGLRYGVTLVPDHDGDLTTWGALDNWISGPRIETLSRPVLHEIAAHVREAARTMEAA